MTFIDSQFITYFPTERYNKNFLLQALISNKQWKEYFLDFVRKANIQLNLWYNHLGKVYCQIKQSFPKMKLFFQFKKMYF